MKFLRRKHQPTLLLMAASPLVRKLLCLLLEREGVNVLCVETLDAALHAMHLVYPDMLLADTKDAHGLLLIRRVRSSMLLADLPIIGIVAANDTDCSHQALSAGADCLLHKPFQIQAVRQLIADYGNNPRQQPSSPRLPIGIISDCDLQRRQLEQLLNLHGYSVQASCHPQQWLQVPADLQPQVRLWLLDSLDPEDDHQWAEVTERLQGPMLFGIGRAPLERGGQRGSEFLAWERRLLNKIEIALFNRVMSRPNALQSSRAAYS